MKAAPEISVIIPALNEERYIKMALEGLRKQSFKEFEIIVVDGGSRDKTRDMAKGYGQVVIERRKGISIARNSGASASKGSILVFLDADSKPSGNLLLEYHKTFKNNKVVTATGPIKPLEDVNVFVNTGYYIVSVLLVNFSILVRIPCIVGSNFAVRRSAFEKAKGFNPKLITYEDWDLSKRLRKSGKAVFVWKAEIETSARRVLKWGVHGYFYYHLVNIFMYYLKKRARTDYKPIR